MQSQAKQKLITHVVQRWNVSDDKRIAPCGTSNTAKKNEKLFFKISVVSIESQNQVRLELSSSDIVKMAMNHEHHQGNIENRKYQSIEIQNDDETRPLTKLVVPSNELMAKDR